MTEAFMSNHTAIILIALGGPRNLDEVGPFMEAFMGRPAPPPVIAAVKERYQLIGGGSPLPSASQALLYAPVVTSFENGDRESAITRLAPLLMASSKDSSTEGLEYRKPS